MTASDGFLSVECSSPHSLSSFHTGVSENEEPRPSSKSNANILDATEMNLLSHYLTHTSHTVPFDDDDLYALSVGIPNLAFGNKAVMSSMLALAAACKCHNISKQTSKPAGYLTEIGNLLNLADRHHRGALEQIQTSISNISSYDGILANAALMVLYSSANHCLRVRLVEEARQSGGTLPVDLLPQGSQWISLIRAAHTASTGVLNNLADISGDAYIDSNEAIVRPSLDMEKSVPSQANVLCPEDGPSATTRSLFLPIVLSSNDRALERLSARAKWVADSQPWQQSDWHREELQACLATLPILKAVASASFLPQDVGSDGSRSALSGNDSIPFDRLSKVSPWLGRYLARVTSLTTPRPLRRSIMSFLNQAPLQYLGIVQSVLDSLPMEANIVNCASWENPSQGASQLSMTQLLAMEIFAHWLVFAMLLDGVWWIGGIGQWELAQVLSLMKSQQSLIQSLEVGETWWPESMYNVKCELTKHL